MSGMDIRSTISYDPSWSVTTDHMIVMRQVMRLLVGQQTILVAALDEYVQKLIIIIRTFLQSKDRMMQQMRCVNS